MVYIICVLSLVQSVKGQETTGYTIKNDSIIFTFDVRDYSRYTVEDHRKYVDDEEVDIASVAVAGEFNNWSRGDWKMTKKSKYVYQLAKSLDDFTDRFSWEFKYVVNEKYWAEPYVVEENNLLTKIKDYFYVDSRNLRLFTSMPTADGNTLFKLKGYEDANEVVLSGSFNYWHESLYKMQKTEDGWTLRLDLRPGQYEYKFIIDGHWIEDPDNPNKVENEYMEYNSYIDVLAPVTFTLENYADAENVYLAGSFNDWEEQNLAMQKTDSGWTLTLDLIGGKHQYKFVVDGEWIIDPKNSLKEYDAEGNINSVLMLR